MKLFKKSSKENKFSDNAIELLHNSKLSYLDFIMQSYMAKDYVAWCKGMGQTPDEDSAEFYFDMHNNTAEVEQLTEIGFYE